MYSSYVTRTGLHKILPFHRILFGRISYCSALYFDTATPGRAAARWIPNAAYIFGQTKWNSILRGLEERSYARYGQSSLVYGERPFAALSFIFSILATLARLNEAQFFFIGQETIPPTLRKYWALAEISSRSLFMKTKVIIIMYLLCALI